MLDKLRKYCQDHKGPGELTVVVGYTQEYALEVHERTDVKRRVGQPKFLEQAARDNEKQIVSMVSNSKPKELADNLLKAGLLIQRESQKLCPVDTSALRASAFTSMEENVDQAASEAEAKSDAIRRSVLAQRAEKEKR